MCEVIEEGQGKGALGDFFGDGEVAFFSAEVLGDKRLEVDGGEVVAAGDALFTEEV